MATKRLKKLSFYKVFGAVGFKKLSFYNVFGGLGFKKLSFQQSATTHSGDALLEQGILTSAVTH